jgi:phosphoribosylformylglycinamidine synthase subunit PurL
MQVQDAEELLFLLGPRSARIGGSVLAAIATIEPAGPLPEPDYGEVNSSISTVVQGIRVGCISAAHDISDGGVLACIAEMCLGGDGDGTIGASIRSPGTWAPNIPQSAALFGEAGGFVVTVPRHAREQFERIAREFDANPIHLGRTGGSSLKLEGLCDIALADLSKAWMSSLKDLFA